MMVQRMTTGLALIVAASFLTSDTWWDWRTIPAAAITADGKRVAYVLQRQDRNKDAVFANVWLVDSDGRNRRPLTQGDFRDGEPAWSPDGTRLAYVSNRSGSSQVHARWIEGGHDAQIARTPEPPSGLAWSRDGRRIAFLARVPGKPEFNVKLADPPKGVKWAEPASVVTRLKWRADKTPGQGLIPYGETQLFVVGADGGAVRQVSPAGYSFSGTPRWTPDGSRLVVAGSKQPDADRQVYPDDIYSVALDGKVERVTSLSGNESSPVVSPDGRQVAFLGFADKGNANHNTNIYVAGIAGGAPRQLAVKLDRNVLHLHWAAEGNVIYGIIEDRGAAHLGEFKLDGTWRALTSGPEVRWTTGYADSGSPPAISSTGTAVMGYSDPRHARDLYSVSLYDPSKKTRLTAANDGLLEGRALGAVEEIRYKSFDGAEIQGWIIKPPGFDAGKKYPLILDIHGGPHAMYGPEFQWQMQVHAARGFVVLYTNPRGSTGYGEEFGNVIHAKYPGDDFHDLMAGVDAIIAKGYVDPAKLFVTGGSGGGILTAWVVTHTNRFRAAVSQYPVINWITQAGSSDIPLVMHRWMKSTPWENPKQYLERSPLMMVDKVTTPTMLLTGEEDWRTPIAQTEEFYVALKTRGIDTVMVRFPNEPHGIRGAHPSHWVAKVEYILGWFERYLR